MIPACSARAVGLRTSGAVLAIIGGLAGCAPPTPPLSVPPTATGSPPAADQKTPAAPAGEALPAGAIAVGPDLYQVPVGEDAAGCVMYRLYSPTAMVAQAIAWRRPDGSFTLDRREAACAR